MSRIEQLQSLLKAEPGDAFLHFALAMEYRKHDQTDEAMEELDRICSLQPDYVPAYFQKARILIDLHRSEEARETLHQGIEVAKRNNDSHAAAEMTDVLNML